MKLRESWANRTKAVATVQTPSITDSRLSSSLFDQLNTALQDFQQRQTGAGNTAVSACIVFDKATY